MTGNPAVPAGSMRPVSSVLAVSQRRRSTDWFAVDSPDVIRPVNRYSRVSLASRNTSPAEPSARPNAGSSRPRQHQIDTSGITGLTVTREFASDALTMTATPSACVLGRPLPGLRRRVAALSICRS
jgi:hypothetical protein